MSTTETPCAHPADRLVPVRRFGRPTGQLECWACGATLRTAPPAAPTVEVDGT